MYCPQCATPNAGDVKFCRSCGTELEAVALALSGKSALPIDAETKKTESKTEQDWIEKRIEGVSGITRGSILLAVSLLIGAAMAVFTPFEVPWILIWMVFFGWLAVWGGIEMAYGIGSVIESKTRLRLLERTGTASVDAIQQRLVSGSAPPTFPDTHRPSRPGSVTEGTTRQLND